MRSCETNDKVISGGSGRSICMQVTDLSTATRIVTVKVTRVESLEVLMPLTQMAYHT